MKMICTGSYFTTISLKSQLFILTGQIDFSWGNGCFFVAMISTLYNRLTVNQNGGT